MSALHRHVAAVDLDLPRALEQPAAAGALGLEAGQDDRVAVVRELVGEVVDDAAAGGHARRGDDDARVGRAVERAGTPRPSRVTRRSPASKTSRRAQDLGAELLAARRRARGGRRRGRRAPSGCRRRPGTRGISPASISRRSSRRTSSVRSTAKAGISTLPPRSTVRRMASARIDGSGVGCRRSPYVDSTTIVSTRGGSAGGRSSGWWRRPRSPLKRARCPSSSRVAVVEPRMWPAGRSVTRRVRSRAGALCAAAAARTAAACPRRRPRRRAAAPGGAWRSPSRWRTPRPPPAGGRCPAARSPPARPSRPCTATRPRNPSRTSFGR